MKANGKTSGQGGGPHKKYQHREKLFNLYVKTFDQLSEEGVSVLNQVFPSYEDLNVLASGIKRKVANAETLATDTLFL